MSEKILMFVLGTALAAALVAVAVATDARPILAGAAASASVALDATDSYTRFSGWLALGGFSAIGASFVAAIRRTEATKAGRIGEPRP